MRLFAIVALVAAGPALAGPGDGFGHMGYGYGSGMMFGPVLWLLVLGFVVVGVVWFLRRDQIASQPSALAELDMRLARGEIDAEDYAARRKLLAQT